MAKPTRNLTVAEDAARPQRRSEYDIIFINGKQKWVWRGPAVDDTNMDGFVRADTEPAWLLQTGIQDLLRELERERNTPEFHQAAQSFDWIAIPSSPGSTSALRSPGDDAAVQWPDENSDDEYPDDCPF